MYYLTVVGVGGRLKYECRKVSLTRTKISGHICSRDYRLTTEKEGGDVSIAGSMLKYSRLSCTEHPPNPFLLRKKSINAHCEHSPALCFFTHHRHFCILDTVNDQTQMSAS